MMERTWTAARVTPDGQSLIVIASGTSKRKVRDAGERANQGIFHLVRTYGIRSAGDPLPVEALRKQ